MKSVDQSRLQKTNPDRVGVSKGVFIAFLSIAIITLIISLWLAYAHQYKNILQAKSNDLQTIAESKTDQIELWVQEYLNDAAYASELFAEPLFQALINKKTIAEDTDIIRLANLLAETEGYENIIIATAKGQPVFYLNHEIRQLDPETILAIQQTLNSGQAESSDIYLNQTTKKIHLDFVIQLPLTNLPDKYVLILCLEPEKQLFPIIQTWPTYSQSAETIIVRREDDHVLFLNVLRQDSSPALSIKIPLVKTDVPAVQAVLGKTGTTEGKDYRGVEVIAVIMPVEGTNWFLIAKEDRDEMLASAQLLAVYFGVILFLVIIMTIFLAAYRFNVQQKNLYQDLFQTKAKQVEMQEEIRTTLYSIGDGVITTDDAGKITRLNPVAEQLTGWREAEAIGKPLYEVFKIINEDSREPVENPVIRVLREAVIVGLANHTLLIAKDGLERPIADSGAPIRNKQGKITGVVLVFRDQTQERTLQKEMALLTDTIRASINEIYIFDANTLKFRFVNNGALENLGYSFDELVNMTPVDIKPDFSLETFTHLIEPLTTHEKQLLVFETFHQRADHTIYPVEVHLQLYHHHGDDVYLAVVQDITERNRAEEKLRSSEERYRHLFTQMNEGFALHEIVCDPTGKPINYIYLDVNPAFEKSTSQSKESLLGRSVLEVFPGTKPFWIETYGKVALEGTSIKFENYHEGLNKWFSVWAFSPKLNQFACIVTDITEQKISENILRDSEEKFRFLFDHMAHGVVYQNADGMITLANKAACDILGLSMDQLQGRSSLDPEWHAINEDKSPFPGKEHPSMISIKTGRIIRDVIMGVHNPVKGEYTWININSTPQFRPGEMKAFASFTTFEDITKRKLAEDILRQQIEELRRWNAVTLGRENRILELKKEINQLLIKSGKAARYTSVKDNKPDD
jgi:PAS domain S-box-containing protein